MPKIKIPAGAPLKFTNAEIINMNRKRLEELGMHWAHDLIEQGEQDPIERLVLARKAIALLEGFVQGLDSEARSEIIKHQGKTTVGGSEVSISSTGTRLDYQQDIIYAVIKRQLDERKSALDHAFRFESNTYDDDGIKVPRVKVRTPSREILRVKL